MRTRSYAEGDDFFTAAQWGDTRSGRERSAVDWAHTDNLDLPHPETGRRPQLYNLDAVAYESIMLGFFQIHHGPANEECARKNLPKITELNFAYSRDGFHWHRPDRTPALRSERRDVWDRGYIQPVGNLCTVSRDQITFYFTGFQGAENSDVRDGMYHRGATGIAFLRRDGFASMNAENAGELLTRPIQFSGEYLFVNLDAPDGELRVEAVGPDGKVIPAYTRENCRTVSGNDTLIPVTWGNVAGLRELKGRAIRLRFLLKRGKLYSFWISKDKTGHSAGYVAGGSPDYSGPRDL